VTHHPLLLTGFAPFGGRDENPTQRLMRRLAGRPGLACVVLPVEYAGAPTAFARAFDRFQPWAVVSFGLAGDARAFRVERVARNRDDSPAPDNAGTVRQGMEIVARGPDTHLNTLPVALLLDSLRAAGLEAGPSDDAGGFVCNHLFYHARHLIETRGVPVPMGFVHVPPAPPETLDTAAWAIVAALRAGRLMG
jgi:pyroglutamyl-peptidase